MAELKYPFRYIDRWQWLATAGQPLDREALYHLEQRDNELEQYLAELRSGTRGAVSSMTTGTYTCTTTPTEIVSMNFVVTRSVILQLWWSWQWTTSGVTGDLCTLVPTIDGANFSGNVETDPWTGTLVPQGPPLSGSLNTGSGGGRMVSASCGNGIPLAVGAHHIGLNASKSGASTQTIERARIMAKWVP